MADVKEALRITLKHEGGYVHDPDDPGGETYKGVARRSNQNWLGWRIVDDMKHNSDFPKCLDSHTVLQQRIVELYKNKYWDRVKGDLIENQTIANKIFDIAVNMGPGTAAKLLQATLSVKVDGSIGKQTLSALNAVNFDLFMANFRLVIISRYMAICKNRYKSRKFLYGWIKRALA